MRNTKVRVKPRMHGIVMPQFLTVGVLSSAIAFLGFRQLSHNDTVPVVMATAALQAGSIISKEDVRIVEVDKDDAPAKPIQKPEQIIGKKIVRNAGADQPLSVEHFLVPRSNGFSSIIPPGHVMVPLSLHNRTIPKDGLVGGDRIDIMVTYRWTQSEGVETKRTAIMAQNILVVGYNRTQGPAASESSDPLAMQIAGMTSSTQKSGPEPTQLLLAVEPDDVVKLAQIDDEPSYDVNIVLHNRHDGDVVDIKSPVYQLPKPPKKIEVIHGDRSEFMPAREKR